MKRYFVCDMRITPTPCFVNVFSVQMNTFIAFSQIYFVYFVHCADMNRFMKMFHFFLYNSVKLMYNHFMKCSPRVGIHLVRHGAISGEQSDNPGSLYFNISSERKDYT